MAKQNLVGQRFGRIVVIQKAQKLAGRSDRHSMWVCQCDCGNQKIIAGDKLLAGYTKSCGCLKSEIASKRIKEHGKPHITHGLSYHRLYNIYTKMKDRCYKAEDNKYQRYGGRGISVCDEWLSSFQAFYDWAMANGYRDDLTIDRIDNDGNYCPENCRWATPTTQQNNKSTNRHIEYQGEMVTIAEAARLTGIPKSTLWWRVNKGWSADKLFDPVNNGGMKYENNA